MLRRKKIALPAAGLENYQDQLEDRPLPGPGKLIPDSGSLTFPVAEGYKKPYVKNPNR
jgi:hypothetical protein